MRIPAYQPDQALDTRTNSWLDTLAKRLQNTHAFHCGSWEFTTKVVDKAYGQILITGSGTSYDVCLAYPCRITGISATVNAALSGVETISVSPAINTVQQTDLVCTLDATNNLFNYSTPNNASDETILSLDAGDLLGVSLSHADLGGLYTVNVTVFTI